MTLRIRDTRGDDVELSPKELDMIKAILVTSKTQLTKGKSSRSDYSLV